MSTATVELLKKVLALPEDEQQEFAEVFYQHLENEETDLEAPSRAEMESRIESIRSGMAELSDIAEANQRLDQQFKEGFKSSGA